MIRIGSTPTHRTATTEETDMTTTTFPQCTLDDVRLERVGGALRYVCDAEGCGREGHWHSTRTAEGKTLALRDHADHVAHMAQGPNRYCTHGCPHLRQQADALARVTGSVSATVRHERREADGTLTVLGEATSSTRMCPCGLLAATPGDRYCEPCRDGVNNS